MLLYDNRHDSHITETARNMVALANRENASVKATFNKIVLIAEPGTMADKIVADYTTKCVESVEALHNSPKGKQEEEEKQREIQTLQKVLDTAMEELDTINFTNLVDVINWLEGIRDATDRIGVNRPVERIIAVFKTNGFESGPHLNTSPNRESEAEYAQWIIEVALLQLNEFQLIHKSFHDLIEDWRERFHHDIA